MRRDAGHPSELWLEPRDDLVTVRRSLVARLQRDRDSSAVHGRIRAVRADERYDVIDLRVLAHHVGDLRLELHHARKGDVRSRFGHTDYQPRVLLREEALGYDPSDEQSKQERGDGREQGRALMPEDPGEPTVIQRDQSFERLLRPAMKSSPLG